MTAKFELIDRARGRFLIHEDGEIERTDLAFAPSSDWTFAGLASNKPGFGFGKRVVAFKDITPQWIADHPLLYKNGKPRFVVDDIDHGTQRMWGEHRAGVMSIRFLPVKRMD